MNKQYKGPNRRGIEWCTHTWNPVGGCKHACRWEMPDGSIAECYAETVAKRVAQAAYPNGFDHIYWHPEKLDAPLRAKKPARIFLDSMSDLMGIGVTDERINQVLDTCRQAHWHSFMLLTKNAPRLSTFDFPDNVWVGVSAPPTFMFGKRLSYRVQARWLSRALDALHTVDAPVRWMSIEPLSFDIAPLLEGRSLQWAVIGAATNGPKTYQPEAEWVENVLTVLDDMSAAVFFKGNLDWDPWREEFPSIVSASSLSTPV